MLQCCSVAVLHVKMIQRTVSLSEGAGDPFTWGAASDACGSSGPDMMATELCGRGKGMLIYSKCIVGSRFGEVVVVESGIASIESMAGYW